jgi:excisionase family DNA binding protein
MPTFHLPPGPGKDLLTARDVADRLSISVRTVWRMTARGVLPQPVRYNRKLVRWKAADIDRYVASLAPARLPGPPAPDKMGLSPAS